MVVVNGERLQIRVDPAEKRLLERAAEAAHVSVSAFVVQSAAMRAEEILTERQTIRLSASVAEAFTHALEQPATRLGGARPRRVAATLCRTEPTPGQSGDVGDR